MSKPKSPTYNGTSLAVVPIRGDRKIEIGLWQRASGVFLVHVSVCHRMQRRVVVGTLAEAKQVKSDLIASRPPPKQRAVHHRSQRKRSAEIPRPKIEELQSGEVPVPRVRPNSEVYDRPRTRGDCLPGGCNEQRPCPWVSCRYHLFLDVTCGGNIRFNFPGLEPWELEQTCALDVAEWSGATLDETGERFNLTRERIRQIEALAKGSARRLTKRSDREAIRELLADPAEEIETPMQAIVNTPISARLTTRDTSELCEWARQQPADSDSLRSRLRGYARRGHEQALAAVCEARPREEA